MSKKSEKKPTITYNLYCGAGDAGVKVKEDINNLIRIIDRAECPPSETIVRALIFLREGGK